MDYKFWHFFILFLFVFLNFLLTSSQKENIITVIITDLFRNDSRRIGGLYMTMKYSRQRAAILSYLQSRKDHPTAESVYSNVKAQFPNISLGTVYRNLNQLAEVGMIAKHSFGALGIDRFDYNTTSHYHFVCNCCNAVIDLPLENNTFLAIEEKASRDFDGLIQEHRLYFCGICKNCLDKQSNQKETVN